MICTKDLICRTTRSIIRWLAFCRSVWNMPLSCSEQTLITATLCAMTEELQAHAFVTQKKKSHERKCIILSLTSLDNKYLNSHVPNVPCFCYMLNKCTSTAARNVQSCSWVCSKMVCQYWDIQPHHKITTDPDLVLFVLACS